MARDRSVLLRMVGGTIQAKISADRTLIFEASKEASNRAAAALVERLKVRRGRCSYGG